MAYLAVANQPSEVDGEGVSATTGARDTNYARNTISLSTTGYFVRSFPAGADRWVRFTQQFGILGTRTVNGRTFFALRSGTTDLFRAVGTGTNDQYRFEVWDGVAWVVLGTQTFTAGLKSLTLHLNATATGWARVYLDAALLFEALGDFTAAGPVDNFWVGSPNASWGLADFSECIIASHDCRYSRLKAFNLTAAGALQQWTGAVGDINAYNSPDTTFIHSATAGQEATYAAADLAADSMNVGAIVMAARARNTGVAPLGMDMLVRAGATNYGQDAGALADTFAGKQAIWENNPATAAPWTRTEANAVELGVRSK